LSFPLSSGQGRAITLQFTSSGEAVGFNSGEISYTATDGTNFDTISLPITVEISKQIITENQPPLTVTPDFWSESLQPGESTSESFTVCTNSHTALSAVTFTPSPGASGSWVSGINPLGSMLASTCQNKALNLTVSNGTLPGVYTGSIQVVGQGVANAQDTISLYIVVQQTGMINATCGINDTGACNCPVGSEYWGVPLCNCQPANLYVLNGTIHGGSDDGKPYNGTLRAGAGTSIIAGTNEADIIYTGQSGDRVCGNGGDDIIFGGNSPDIIDGNAGNDVIYGGSGDDTLYGKDGNDEIHGGQGYDSIDGGDGDDTIYGDDQDDLIYGGPGNDVIYGGNGKDKLCGNAGNDRLYGENNNNVLDGGTGINILNGGTGNNVCYRGPTFTNCQSTPPGIYDECGPS